MEIDRIRLRFDRETIVDKLWRTDDSEVPLSKPIKLKAGKTYDFVMFNDRSIEVWRLMARENKYEMQ